VPRATVALLVGAGESNKSWLSLVLATGTAAGRAPFAAEETGDARLAAGPVLYLTGENSLGEEQRRCALLKAGHGLPDDLPITFVAAESLRLSNEADYKEVLRLVEQLEPVAIFIDSASALSGIANENDNPEVRRFMQDRVMPLARRYGATVYVIGHSPKPPAQPGGRFTDEHVARGASEWRNAADVVLYLRRDATLGPQAVVLRHAKQRVGRRPTPIWFSVEDVEPERSARLVYGGTYAEETGQAGAAGLARAVAAVVDALKAAPTRLSLSDLQKQLAAAKFSTATLRRAVDVVRGKLPWPSGPLRGRKEPIVTEEREGKRLFLLLIPTARLADQEPEDA